MKQNRILWQVLFVLHEEVKKKFEKTNKGRVPKDLKNLTDYYFATNSNRNDKYITIGQALKDAFPNLKLGEKCVYNYLHIPAKKQRDQDFPDRQNHPYPDVFFRYLGFKDLEAFLKWCEKKSAIPLDIINRQRQIVEQTESGFKSYYYFYYFNGRQVIRGSVIIESWKRVVLKFNEKNGSKVQLEGDVEINGTQLSMNLTRALKVGAEKRKERTCINFYIGLEEVSNLKYLLGTYSSFSVSRQPTCGYMVLENVDRHSDELLKREIPLHIMNHLIGQRSVIEARTYQNLTSLPSGINRLKRIAGIYESYACISRHNKTKITKTIFAIHPSGLVEAKGTSDLKYTGFIKVLPDESSVKIEIRTLGEATHFSFLLNLKDSISGEIEEMIGLHQGIYRKKLVGGKECFIRNKTYEVEAFDKLEPGEYTITEIKDIKLRKKLVHFFLGEKDDMLPSFKTLEKLDYTILPKRLKDRIKGVYRLYFHSTANAIRQYVLKIDPETKHAIMKTNGATHDGSFIVHKDALIIKLKLLIGSSVEYLIKLVAHIGGEEDGPILRVEGMLTGFSDDSYQTRPVCVRCMLIKTEENFEELTDESFSLDKLIGDNTLIEDQSNILKYLFCSQDNYLETHRFEEINNNNDWSNLPKFKGKKNSRALGIVFFDAAIKNAVLLKKEFNATERDQQNIRKYVDDILKDLRGAFENGFGLTDVERITIQKELEAGGLFSYLKDNIELNKNQLPRIKENIVLMFGM